MRTGEIDPLTLALIRKHAEASPLRSEPQLLVNKSQVGFLLRWSYYVSQSRHITGLLTGGDRSRRERITRRHPKSPWPRSLHLGEEKVSSSSSPHSLRSTPFSLCYKRREPAAAIGPDICQSKAGPAPEVALIFVNQSAVCCFNVAA